MSAIDNLIRDLERDKSYGDDFIRYPHIVPYEIVMPSGKNFNAIYTTKPTSMVREWTLSSAPTRLLVMGRYGLPGDTDVSVLRSLFTNARIVSYVGDLDPLDLTVFAWLRERLAPLDLRYLGINDSLLRNIEKPRQNIMKVGLRMTPFERLHLERLVRIIDLPGLVGRRCAALLSGGSKLELEALFNPDFVVPSRVMKAIGRGKKTKG